MAGGSGQKEESQKGGPGQLFKGHQGQDKEPGFYLNVPGSH